jgi:cytosine/adenosine deaminase-related metal-dependent hydrolase
MTAERISMQAQWVFPDEGDPIEKGVITIVDGCILSINNVSESDTKDLGNVAIIPGLVNAHTHLEFSSLTAPIASGESFADWIRAVIRQRTELLDVVDRSIAAGLKELAVCGTRHVGEIATAAESTTDLSTTASGGTRFLELIATSDESAAAAIDEARNYLTLDSLPGNWSKGLSPHAPYTTSLDLVQRTVELAGEFDAPLAMHLAETEDELKLLRSHDGPLRDLLDELGVWNSDAFPHGSRPLDYLQLLSHAPRSLIIHGNYLDDDEIKCLAEHHDAMALVFCPRTHAYFGHKGYPLQRALEAGVNLALGTDSRASNPDLSVFAELKYAAVEHPDIAPKLLLAAATNARALGLDHGLTVGHRAHLTMIQLAHESQGFDPYRCLLSPESNPMPNGTEAGRTPT